MGTLSVLGVFVIILGATIAERPGADDHGQILAALTSVLLGVPIAFWVAPQDGDWNAFIIMLSFFIGMWVDGCFTGESSLPGLPRS